MKRLYETILDEHFSKYRQMAFLCGPRQVGKTTTAKKTSKQIYLNWDNLEHRKNILSGYNSIINENDFAAISGKGARIVFDEIHKFPRWKNYIKGFFDTYEDSYHIVVTGSARLNIFKRGSDSLMGRYFLYRMHPLSIGELISKKLSTDILIREPKSTSLKDYQNLLDFGGFPEPFIKGEKRFYNRWRKLRSEQLFREDLRDLSNINEISQLEVLAELLENRTGQLINYSSLANDVQVSVNTIKKWISTLEQFYYCFRIKPWHKNVPKTLLKQPKLYFWDWSIVQDQGGRHENFIASHLLKAVHFWTDGGYGTFDLFFLRDKMKREVDFLITRDNKPWFIVEVKSSDSGGISSSLEYFSSILKCEFAFQVEMNSPYVDRNCFSVSKPTRVPALTLLSQLV